MKHDSAYAMAHVGDVDGIREWLQQQPTDINGEIRDGYSLLHVACMFGHEPLMRFLVDRLALVNINAENTSRAMPLHLAVSFRDEVIAERMVRYLIDHGAELNATQDGGQTALHHAVGRGSLRLVRTLIEEGADPYLKDSQKRSAIDVAKSLGDEELATEIRSTLTSVFA